MFLVVSLCASGSSAKVGRLHCAFSPRLFGPRAWGWPSLPVIRSAHAGHTCQWYRSRSTEWSRSRSVLQAKTWTEQTSGNCYFSVYANKQWTKVKSAKSNKNDSAIPFEVVKSSGILVVGGKVRSFWCEPCSPSFLLCHKNGTFSTFSVKFATLRILSHLNYGVMSFSDKVLPTFVSNAVPLALRCMRVEWQIFRNAGISVYQTTCFRHSATEKTETCQILSHSSTCRRNSTAFNHLAFSMRRLLFNGARRSVLRSGGTDHERLLPNKTMIAVVQTQCSRLYTILITGESNHNHAVKIRGRQLEHVFFETHLTSFNVTNSSLAHPQTRCLRFSQTNFSRAQSIKHTVQN